MMPSVSRRHWLRQSACGFGALALHGLLADDLVAAPSGPLAPKPPHFPATAKRVVFLFMHGGVSHVDSFDPKPKLAEMNGQPLPFAKPQFEFAPTGNLLASPWNFQRYGESGIEVSEIFPHVAAQVDDLAVVRYLCSRVALIHRGELIEEGATDRIFDAPESDYAKMLISAAPEVKVPERA